MAFIRFSRLFFAMYDKHLLDLIHGQAAGEIINHLFIVPMAGEAFDLGDLRFDASVESEDGYPLQAGFLDPCTKRSR